MLEFTIGAILASVLITVLRHARFERVLRFWAVTLSVAAAIYVGFVLVGGAHAQWFLVEAGGFILFTCLAFLGLRYSPWVLALAWFAHIAWDTLLHSQNTAFVPQWYPAVCIGFDLVVGAYIIVMSSRLRNPVTPGNGFHGRYRQRAAAREPEHSAFTVERYGKRMSFYQRFRYSLYLAAVGGALIGLVIAVASADIVGLLPRTAFDLLVSPGYLLVIVVVAYLIAPAVVPHFPIAREATTPDQQHNTQTDFSMRLIVLAGAGLLLALLGNLLVYLLR